jgi:hypothetical protein
MLRKQCLVIILMLMLIQTACASTTATPAPTSTEAKPVDECPAATADLKLLTNTEDGYCFLYPADYSTNLPHFIVINPITAPGDMPGEAWVFIQVEAANGRTAAQVADAAIAPLGAGFNITKSDILIDGAQAVVVDGLPGQDSNRMVFIVSNDRLYTLTFAPWYPNANDPTPLENLYTTIVQTLHFLPPK